MARSPSGLSHDALPIVDSSTLPDQEWLDAVMPIMSTANASGDL
jgi:hypothetical protein